MGEPELRRQRPTSVRPLLPVLLLSALAACGSDAGTSSTPTIPPATASGTEPTTTTTSTTTPAPTTSTVAPPPTTTSTTTATTTATTASDPPTTTGPATPTTEDTMDPNTNPTVPDSVLGSEIVQTAITDLRTRIGAPGADITVVSVEEVEWSDGSIGCPQPGFSYTQATVNGIKIVLEYDGITYDYHQGGSRPVFYCAPLLDR